MSTAPPPEPDRGSLAARAFLAVGLTVAFYLLALGIAAGLLWIAWESLHSKHVNARLVVFNLVGAGIILWSVAPRIERFRPPGPRLEPARHPRLFALLREVARATGQPLPADVYLVPEMNAAVAQVGGFLGSGGRRILLLGLPLLSSLGTRELRAVLAHEFGHYHGGDTRLGPWIWSARSAIVRTVNNLARTGSLLRFVFLWYGKAFLRITLAVSRQQELAADRLSASVAGAEAAGSGLRAVHATAQAWDAYLRQEVVPVLGGGLRPPLAEGFRRFLAAPRIAEAVAAAEKEALRNPRGDPYDSHPPLARRLAALGDPPARRDPADPRADSLLEGLPGLEKDLLAFQFSGPGMARLRDARWEDVAREVYVPAWKGVAAKEGGWLRGVRAADLPAAVAARPAPRAGDEGRTPPPAWIGAAATALLLLDRGWEARTEPGRAVVLLRGSEAFDPFDLLARAAGDRAAREEWGRRCAELGIAGCDAGAAPAARPA